MPFFDKEKTKTFYDAKLNFWSFAIFFALSIFWSGATKLLGSYMSSRFVAWLCPLQVPQPITTFLAHYYINNNRTYFHTLRSSCKWCGLCHWDTHSENKLSILWLFAIKMFAWSRASTSTPAIVIIPSINSNLFIGWMRILFRSANTWYTFASPKMPFIHSNLVAKAFRTSH